MTKNMTLRRGSCVLVAVLDRVWVKQMLLVLCLCVLALAAPVEADTFDCATVTCLINQIRASNNHPGPDRINLAPGNYVLTSVDNETDGPNGLPSITGDLTISNMPGRRRPFLVRGAVCLEDNLALCPPNTSPPMRFFHVAASGTLTLQGINLSSGWAVGADPVGEGQSSFHPEARGGAIFVQEPDLTKFSADCLKDVALRNPQTRCGDITITDVNFSTNRANWGGGALFVAGTGCCRRVIITNSTFFDNQSAVLELPSGVSHFLQGEGGAILWDNRHWCEAGRCATEVSRPLSVSNTSFDSNRAERGGAVWTFIWERRVGVTFLRNFAFVGPTVCANMPPAGNQRECGLVP